MTQSTLAGGAYHVRTSGVCEVCLSITRHGNAKWCRRCRTAGDSSKKRIQNIKATWFGKVRTCETCGIQWCNVGWPGRGVHGRYKFCSFCRPDRRNGPAAQPGPRSCQFCGGSFVTAHPLHRFCSGSCRDGAAGRIRQWIDPQSRLSIYERDEFVCWLCSETVDPDDFVVNESGYYVFGPRYPTLDHVMPRSRGGSDDPDNLRTAHHLCNSRRKAPLDVAV